MKHIIEINRLKGFTLLGFTFYWNIPNKKESRVTIKSSDKESIDRIFEAMSDLIRSYQNIIIANKKVRSEIVE